MLAAVHGQEWNATPLGKSLALEIKLTARPRQGDLARLNANADLAGADRRFLICQRSDRIKNGSQVVCDLVGLMEYIERLS